MSIPILAHQQMDAYDTVILDGDNKHYLNQLVKDISWEEDIDQAAAKLNISFAYMPGLEKLVDNGKQLVLLADKPGQSGNPKEFLRTVIFSRNRKTDSGGDISVTAYDHMIYLVKNEDDYIFRSMTAGQIAKKICQDFNIPIGKIVDTGYVLPKLICKKKTLYDMIIMALTETRKVTGKKFILRMLGGKLHLVEKREKPLVWVLEERHNLISASFSESIEDIKTQVKVTGPSDDGGKKQHTLSIVKDEKLIKLYGLLQTIKEESSGDNPGKAYKIAQEILKQVGKVKKEASVSAIGLNDVYKGDPVYIIEKITGLIGTFYVANARHTINDGKHIMDIKLNWTDELPTIEAPKDEEKKKKEEWQDKRKKRKQGKVCPKCGKKNPQDAKFCKYCGFDFSKGGES